MIFLLAMLVGHVGEPANIVDVIEYNYVIPTKYTQYIFWKGDSVVDWRSSSHISDVSYSNGYYNISWTEPGIFPERARFFRVKARQFIRTASYMDREYIDRQKGNMRGLYAEQFFGATRGD